MGNHNKNERVETVSKKIRADGSVRINREILIKNYHLWLDFDYKDWITVLDKIKNSPLKLYAFIPFACRVLGIEVLHELKKLEGVEKRVIDYIGNGEGFSMYLLHNHDLKFFLENKDVIDLAFKSIEKFEEQGAIPIKEYTIHIRKRVPNCIKRYKKIIKREHFTIISTEDICKEAYLFSERNI